MVFRTCWVYRKCFCLPIPVILYNLLLLLFIYLFYVFIIESYTRYKKHTEIQIKPNTTSVNQPVHIPMIKHAMSSILNRSEQRSGLSQFWTNEHDDDDDDDETLQNAFDGVNCHKHCMRDGLTSCGLSVSSIGRSPITVSSFSSAVSVYDAIAWPATRCSRLTWNGTLKLVTH